MIRKTNYKKTNDYKLELYQIENRMSPFRNKCRKTWYVSFVTEKEMAARNLTHAQHTLGRIGRFEFVSPMLT